MRVFNQLLTDSRCAFFEREGFYIVYDRTADTNIVHSVVFEKALVFYRNKCVYRVLRNVGKLCVASVCVIYGVGNVVSVRIYEIECLFRFHELCFIEAFPTVYFYIRFEQSHGKEDCRNYGYCRNQ